MKDEKTLVFLTALSLIFTLFISYSLSAGPASTKYGDLNADGKNQFDRLQLGQEIDSENNFGASHFQWICSL